MYCERPPLKGKRRCRKHGGCSLPPGPAHPAYRHGRYSKVWGRFAKAVDAAIEDEDLLDARRGVAGALGALEEAAERLECGDTPEFRERATALHAQAMELLKADPEAAVAKLRELGTLLDRGVTEDVAFRDVVQRAETYRHAVNDALRLKLHASTALSLQDLILALDAMVQLVLEVSGREAALEVAQRFDQERLNGKLAAAGFQFGARAIAVSGAQNL